MVKQTTTVNAENKQRFEKDVDDVLLLMSKFEKNSFEWETYFNILYTMITPKAERYIKRKIAEKKRLGIRIDEWEYLSEGLHIALLQTVNTFKVDKQTGFIKLYFYRIEQLFINLDIKNNANKRKAINDSGYLLTTDENDYTPESEIHTDEISVLKDPTVSHYIKDFIVENPNGKILLCYEIENRDQRRDAILQILGSENYGANERQAVQRVKNKFKQYLKNNGFDI